MLVAVDVDAPPVALPFYAARFCIPLRYPIPLTRSILQHRHTPPLPVGDGKNRHNVHALPLRYYTVWTCRGPHWIILQNIATACVG